MLQDLQQLILSLAAPPSNPTKTGAGDLDEHRQRTIMLHAMPWHTPPSSAADLAVWQQTLFDLLLASAHLEPVWALMAGTRLWASGQRRALDFRNIWNCARYAGTQSRFSRFGPQHYLDLLQTLPSQTMDPALAIVRGNALRQLHRYAQAEDAYLQGLHTFADDPFLKFRLVDLCLCTHQHSRAKDLLDGLRSRYPHALEHLFTLPVPSDAEVPGGAFSALDAHNADLVWLVAADPLYIQRYGLRWLQGVAKLLQSPGTGTEAPRIHVHVHAITQPGESMPMDTLRAMAQVKHANLTLTVTRREVNLAAASANQRKAIFASERFLFLHELLKGYQTPLLVTDIDVDPLQNPVQLLPQMLDADVAHTHFGSTREAWDRYPATALLFQPTDAAIDFCQQLAKTILALLKQHPDPWFVDQVALFRLLEGGTTQAKSVSLPYLLTDETSPMAYFRLLHGSWENSA